MEIKRVTVKKNERGLLLRNGDFDRVLAPGTHWLGSAIDTLRVETFALEQPAFNHALADYLMAKGAQARFLDPEGGRGKGLQQFLDEKSFRPGLSAYRRDDK